MNEEPWDDIASSPKVHSSASYSLQLKSLHYDRLIHLINSLVHFLREIIAEKCKFRASVLQICNMLIMMALGVQFATQEISIDQLGSRC